MFNGIFGVVLWKGRGETPRYGENTGNTKVNFLMKCRLQRIYNFFPQMSYFTIFGNTKEI